MSVFSRTGTGLPLKTELKLRGNTYTFNVPKTLIVSGLLKEGKHYSLLIIEESD